MKTENLWAPILIHLVNNSVYIGEGIETIFTLKSLLWGLLVNAIVFLPFLFTKEYKTNNSYEGMSSLKD